MFFLDADKNKDYYDIKEGATKKPWQQKNRILSNVNFARLRNKNRRYSI